MSRSRSRAAGSPMSASISSTAPGSGPGSALSRSPISAKADTGASATYRSRSRRSLCGRMPWASDSPIADFRVARLGPLARLRLLGGRALELLRRDPRALFAAFRRYRAGVVRGDAIVSRRGADTQAGDYETWLATFDDDPAREASYYRQRLAGSATLPSFAIFLVVDR